MNNFWFQLQKLETKVEMARCMRGDLLFPELLKISPPINYHLKETI